MSGVSFFEIYSLPCVWSKLEKTTCQAIRELCKEGRSLADRNVQTLHLWRKYVITSKAPPDAKQLRNLRFRGCNPQTLVLTHEFMVVAKDEVAAALCAKPLDVRVLRLHGSTFALAKDIIAAAPLLEELDLDPEMCDLSKVDGKTAFLPALLGQQPQRLKLRTDSSSIHPDIEAALQRCTSIGLKLGCRCGFPSYIGALPGLTSLHVNATLSAEYLKVLTSLTSLKHLHVHSICPKALSLPHLPLPPGLEKLSFKGGLTYRVLAALHMPSSLTQLQLWWLQEGAPSDAPVGVAARGSMDGPAHTSIVVSALIKLQGRYCPPDKDSSLHLWFRDASAPRAGGWASTVAALGSIEGLRRLELDPMDIKLAELQLLLGNLPKLEVLTLRDDLTTAQLAVVGTATTLTGFGCYKLHGAADPHGAAVEPVALPPDLRELLFNGAVHPLSLASLQLPPSLTKLELLSLQLQPGGADADAEGRLKSDVAEALLASFEQLAGRLDASGRDDHFRVNVEGALPAACWGSDGWGRLLARLKLLELDALDLHGFKGLRPADVALMAEHLPKLSHIAVYGPIAVDVLPEFSRFESLEQMEIVSYNRATRLVWAGWEEEIALRWALLRLCVEAPALDNVYLKLFDPAGEGTDAEEEEEEGTSIRSSVTRAVQWAQVELRRWRRSSYMLWLD